MLHWQRASQILLVVKTIRLLREERDKNLSKEKRVFHKYPKLNCLHPPSQKGNIYLNAILKQRFKVCFILSFWFYLFQLSLKMF